MRERRLGLLPRPAPVGAPSLRPHAIAQRRSLARLSRSVQPGWQEDSNDQIGDCTCTLLANVARAQAALGGFGVDIPTSSVVGLYSGVSGYNPAVPGSDTGANEVDVLSYASKHGLAGSARDGVPYVPYWAGGDGADPNLMRVIAEDMGLAYLCVRLMVSDQGADVWKPTSSADTLWGYHALGVWDWEGIGSNDEVRLETWGGVEQRATWGWLAQRTSQVWAVAFPQLTPAGGRMFAGMDREQWRADVESFVA